MFSGFMERASFPYTDFAFFWGQGKAPLNPMTFPHPVHPVHPVKFHASARDLPRSARLPLKSRDFSTMSRSNPR